MKEEDKQATVAGIILTALVTVGFIWAGYQWFACSRGSSFPATTAAEMRLNETRAFGHLQQIVAAQAEFVKTDWDKDGTKQHAVFMVHLHTVINEDNDPETIALIPKPLAFRTARGYKGYSYREMRRRGSPRASVELDYETEWGVSAFPVSFEKHRGERLSFLADQSGNILAKSDAYPTDVLPLDPLAEGWRPINTTEDLRAIQSNLPLR
jgi:hypothetical protein